MQQENDWWKPVGFMDIKNNEKFEDKEESEESVELETYDYDEEDPFDMKEVL